jgi:hypothetical protein
MADEQVINNEQGQEGLEQGQAAEGQAQAQGKQEAGKAAASLTAGDKQEIDAVKEFIDKQDLPKEIKYFKDKSGKLMFQVPIDGSIYTVDFAGMVKGFNLNQAGYKKLEEGKAIQKQFAGFIEKLKKNPNELKSFAKRLGLDPVQLAQGWLQEAVDEESLTPEQRELKAFKAEKEAFEKEKETHKKTLEEQRISAESEKYQNKYSEDLISALAKHNISKDTASFGSLKGVAKMAVAKIKSSLEKGIDMNMEDAVNEAKQDVTTYIQDFLMSVDDDHIIDALPPKFVDRILKASLNRKVVTPTTNTVGKQVELKQTGKSIKTKGKKVDMDEYFRALGQ